MANLRISELTNLPGNSLSGSDLLLVSQVSTQESKKLQISELSSYILNNGNITGSFNGTASYSRYAGTASYIASVPTSSYSITCSYALNSATGLTSVASSSWASSSISASYAVSCSWANITTAESSSVSTNAKTASFVNYTGIDNGTVYRSILSNLATNSTNSLSASYVSSAATSISASYANVANSSIYSATSGVSNFTSRSISSSFASASISSSYSTRAALAQDAILADYAFESDHAIYADTASYGIVTAIFASASFASSSISASYAKTASYVDSANSALMSQNSIYAVTASYVAPTYTTLQHLGIFAATTQSNYKSQLDLFSIIPTINGSATSSFENVGTVIVNYTSSIPINSSINLYVLDRSTGTTSLIDSFPVYVHIDGNYGSINGSITGSLTGSFSGSAGSGSISGSISGLVNASVTTNITGSTKIPFTLLGSIATYGSYMVYTTASSNDIRFDSRTIKYRIDGPPGVFSAGASEPTDFKVSPESSLLVFSGSGTGPFIDTATNIVGSGSSNVTYLWTTSSAVNSLQYLWTLTNLKELNCSNNPYLYSIDGLPSSIETMSINNTNISALLPLTNTSLSILNAANTYIVSYQLPPTMSYFNCSATPLTTLPDPLPTGLLELSCSYTNLNTLPTAFPDTLVSMSIHNNYYLPYWFTAFPISMSYFNGSKLTSISELPTSIPVSCSYFNAASCSLTSTNQDYICQSLVTNGQYNGILTLGGNASLLPITLTRISTLTGRGWTVVY